MEEDQFELLPVVFSFKNGGSLVAHLTAEVAARVVFQSISGVVEVTHGVKAFGFSRLLPQPCRNFAVLNFVIICTIHN